MYDVDINTNEIISVIERISGSIYRLDEMARQMIVAMESVRDDFTSANYTRAAYGVKKSTDSVEVMESNLKDTQRYLYALVEIIEKYNRIKY